MGRRFQVREREIAGTPVTLVDDYGRHPTGGRGGDPKRSASAGGDRRLVMVYQPHRYTRTRDLHDDFVRVLSQPDLLVLLEVYAAGEAPIAGADGRGAGAGGPALAPKLDPLFVEGVDDVPEVLAGVLRDGDVVLTQGAGDVGRLAAVLASAGGAA